MSHGGWLLLAIVVLNCKSGMIGTIEKQWRTHSDFYTVLIWKTGTSEVFHKSQLEAKGDE